MHTFVCVLIQNCWVKSCDTIYTYITQLAYYYCCVWSPPKGPLKGKASENQSDSF